MSSDSNEYMIKSTQVQPLPTGSGGNNAIKHQLDNTNIQLTMLASQANADTKYDPPVPQHVSKPVTIEGFCIDSSPSVLIVIGVLLIAYGIITK